jgi:hypothetical protein
MKKGSEKPPARSHSRRGTARQAPETNATSRGPPAAACPAHAMPVKWTTPPLVFTARPPSAVTSPCHALQSPRGSRMASRKPGAGVASGFMNNRTSPVAARAPAFAPAAKPALRPVCSTIARGAISPTTATVSSEDALSTTSSSSPGASCAHSDGSASDTAERLL